MLSFLLVQHALAPGISEANMRSRLPGNRNNNPASDTGPLAYLKITGALALRFNVSPPPPDLTTKPAASAPPFPAAAEAAETTPAPSPNTSTSNITTTQPNESVTPAASYNATEAAPPAPAAPTVKATPTILPDDTRPTTRPEDFLPYFQFPGSTGNGNDSGTPSAPRPPAPGQLPPSSATYQQK